MTRHAATLLVAFVVAASAPGFACRRSGKSAPPPVPAPLLDAVEIVDVSEKSELIPKSTAKYDTGALVDIVRSALIKAQVVVTPMTEGDAAIAAPGSRRAVARVRGRVGVELVEVEEKGLVRAAVALQVSSKPAEAPGALNEELSAAGEQPYPVSPTVDRRALAQRLLERTTVDLIDGFVARVALATAPPERVHAALVGDAGVLREEAIRVAGSRGLKDEVPALLPLLQNDDERLRDAALGALIAMRERRAVAELTRNRSMRDRHEMRKVLEAISILGGDEARDYLSFVAASHDDEEIRKLAADAKARLDRRESRPGEARPAGEAPAR
jgi:hypothetical protein